MKMHTTRILTALTGLLLASSALAETVYDSTSTAIQYAGAWNHESSAINPVYGKAFNGTLSETQNAGAKASLTFTANRFISLVFTMGSNRWKSAIYINGQHVETINARTPEVNQRWQVMKTWKVPQGTNTIEVVALGAIDGQDIHQSWSDVDAFIVDADAAVPGTTTLSATYLADSSLLEYGGTWTWVEDATYGNRMQSQTAGNSVRLTFYGESVALKYYASANRGIAEVTLDGVLQPDLDQYSASSELKTSRWTGLTPGMHTLTITVSGRKNPSATNDIVGVTKFVVGR